uniref:Uncharacterized protein n=1 Tax=Plectus sambesii TaxID=2011161 RepID=A0A914XIC7_9BILA
MTAHSAAVRREKPPSNAHTHKHVGIPFCALPSIIEERHHSADPLSLSHKPGGAGHTISAAVQQMSSTVSPTTRTLAISSTRVTARY